jgi:uncharacterized protein YyaL (SSP411 family)
MNQYFVCIKVDREERPDVDQVYMEALQAMGVPGGWPLHVFLSPEAKPFYGGTYFPPSNWSELLTSIGQAYQDENRKELDASAEAFAQILQASELEKYRIPTANQGFSDNEFKQLVDKLAESFDQEWGGLHRTPKFALPSVWRFLLRAYQLNGSKDLGEHLNLTLRKMAWGGIYDQVGGGFARYSVDAEWLVPHFEKMLYDNAQLVSLYAEAYQTTQESLYEEVAVATIRFVERELASPEGGFYCSLDADSAGQEGAFYVFTQEELRAVLGEEEALAAAYYNCTASGNWEHGRNILHRRASDNDFAEAHHLAPNIIPELVRNWQQKLLAARNQRARPSLDDKILAGWNALMLQGLLDAYRAFANPDFLALARRNAQFIEAKLRNGAGLYRSYKNGRASINGFLEDYALVVQAYISLYEATFEETWLREAESLTGYVLTHFFDPVEEQFFYTDATGEKLIARRKELFDNVIPASNSVMAHNLHRLGLHLENHRYANLATAMLRRVQALVVKEPQHLANWAALYAAQLKPTTEIAIVGPEAPALRQELARNYLPNTVLAGTETLSALPLLRGRAARDGKTTIYVCINRACQQPVHTVAEALAQL